MKLFIRIIPFVLLALLLSFFAILPAIAQDSDSLDRIFSGYTLIDPSEVPKDLVSNKVVEDGIQFLKYKSTIVIIGPDGQIQAFGKEVFKFAKSGGALIGEAGEVTREMQYFRIAYDHEKAAEAATDQAEKAEHYKKAAVYYEKSYLAGDGSFYPQSGSYNLMALECAFLAQRYSDTRVDKVIAPATVEAAIQERLDLFSNQASQYDDGDTQVYNDANFEYMLERLNKYRQYATDEQRKQIDQWKKWHKAKMKQPGLVFPQGKI